MPEELWRPELALGIITFLAAYSRHILIVRSYYFYDIIKFTIFVEKLSIIDLWATSLPLIIGFIWCTVLSRTSTTKITYDHTATSHPCRHHCHRHTCEWRL